MLGWINGGGKWRSTEGTVITSLGMADSFEKIKSSE